MARYRTVLEVEDGSQLSDGVGGARHWEAKTFFVCDLLTDLPLPSTVDKGSMAFVLEDQSRWYTQDSNWYEETAAAVSTDAPADATYLTLSANATLSNETVVGATPGGELDGTWASPTVDATHSGSTHAATQAAAEATAAAANTADIAAHAAAVDPHTGYLKESNTIDFLVGTATTDLAGEIVVGATPGGELGNTWASPTVDASHSGSTHAATQAAAEATAAAANTADIATHAGLADPHTGYRLESADHTHASTGIQAGTIAHSVTTGITATDHHVAPAAGPDANVTVDSAGAAGTASTFARSGHGHQVATDATAQVAITPDAAATAGTSATVARSQHQHGMATYSSAAAALGTAAAGTSGQAPSRGDHVHPTTGLALSAEMQTEVTQAELRMVNDISLTGTADLMWATPEDWFLQGSYSPDPITIPNNYYRLHYLDLQLINDLTMEGSAELVLFDFLPHGDLTLA